jgi:hypothetical protein
MKLRTQQWDGVQELATQLTGFLGRAYGSRRDLLNSLEKDRLEVARAEAEAFLRKIPAPGAQVDEQTLVAMSAFCHFVLSTGAEIEGRMQTEADRG